MAAVALLYRDAPACAASQQPRDAGADAAGAFARRASRSGN
jgi:hypothetical protein